MKKRIALVDLGKPTQYLLLYLVYLEKCKIWSLPNSFAVWEMKGKYMNLSFVIP